MLSDPIESNSTFADMEKIGAELAPSVIAAIVKKDLQLVRSKFGKRVLVLKAGEVALGGMWGESTRGKNQPYSNRVSDFKSN